ncbi:Uncharacterized protein C354.08c [Serendipita indica DSM 11827]|nr:Uncharacterized protein C354.08c [Serendipita indica DSM 11827]
MSSIDIGNLVNNYNNHLSAVLPKAVGSNLVLWSAGSLAVVFLFNILRPRNKIIYEPKVKYHEGNKAPPPIDNGFFSWVKPLWSTSEDVLLEKVGLDGVTYLRFLRMMSWIFLLVSVLTCGALIPINISYNYKNVDARTRNTLSILTVQDVQGTTLFFHVAASYIINIIVLVFVWMNWRKMVALRYKFFRSDEYIKSFYARTLMILNVPKKLQSDEGLQALFAGLQIPYPATSVHIGRRVGQLPELVEYHNDTVRSFEQVLVSYLKGGKIGKKRPTITMGGCLGMGGEKKDAIEFYTRKLAKTEAAVQDWRERNEHNKPENYGFASLAAVPYAHIVAQRLNGKHPKGTTITLAPNPKDIIWKNITMTDATRRSQRMIGWVWLATVCFFNTIPLLFISLVANLSHVAQYVPFLETWQTQEQWSFALVNGILPPTISAIFGFFLPRIMRWLSRYQGAITHSRLDRAVVARYFAFLIISQLFIFSLLGVGFQLVTQIVISVQKGESVWEILKNTKDLPRKIQSTYIAQAPYWLTFFPLRGFLAVFDLAQLINVIWIWIKTRMFGRTPRDIREWTQPPEFEYGIYYSNLLFMGAVGLIYAPLAPLVALAAGAVFLITSITSRYQIMFVFVSRVESGGRLWNVVINRLLISLILMQLLMTLTIGLAHGWRSFYWVSCLPPIIFVVICKIWWQRTFMEQFRYYIPSDQELASTVVHSERADNKGNRLEKRFGHPALHADLFTPMLHKKMMPLLAEVYHGRLATDSAKLEEYGGQKLQAQIAPGGIKIAGVDEQQLEYDPALYQRDRGELDWDQRSIGAGTVLGDGSTLSHSKSGFYASSTRGAPAGYDQYMQQGPMRTGTPSKGLNVESYEMSRRGGSEANLPLLNTQGAPGYASQYSLHDRSPSVGPHGAYGASHDAPSGYFSPAQQTQGYHPQEASDASMRYHARANSAGFDQTIATGYPPQQQQQHYVDRSQSPSVYQQRSGSSMGYHQQGPPRSQAYSPSDQGPPVATTLQHRPYMTIPTKTIWQDEVLIDKTISIT